jgi:hypothetical protein
VINMQFKDDDDLGVPSMEEIEENLEEIMEDW